MKRQRLRCLLTLILATAPHPAAAGLRAVWATTDGEKVARDSRDHALRARNAAWDGRTIRLFAARNEVVAFQVIVEADERGITAAAVALPELRARGGTVRIAYAPPDPDPSLYAGRPIQLFSVNDLLVTQTSHADWAWKPRSPAAPKNTLGWKPVQLVPENARAGRGGFPVRVAPKESQAFWIEIYTGRGRPAGPYDGTLSVTVDGAKQDVPVELRLFDFELSDSNTLDAMVYFEPDQPEMYQGRRLDAAYDRFAHRHRVELVHGYDQAQVKANLGRFTGADFRPAAGYEGPGEGVGNRIVPASFYGPGPEYGQRDSAWRASDSWMGFLRETLPDARTFLYLPDEPYPADYPRVRAFAENVRSNPGPGSTLPLFLTKTIVPEFQGLVDIWSIPPQALDLAAAASERQKGRRVSFYNGGRPNGPTLLIDAPATEARVVAWAAFKHDLDLYFFWHGVHWQHNRQKQGERKQDVWKNPITFDNRGQPNKPVDDQGYLNGDGVLMYPGEEKLHPEEDRGIAGPISTVQLANLRRGLQDHQYLTLARRLGLAAEVDAAVRAIVPRVFSDAGPTVSFPESGEAFEAARLKLAEAIEAGTRSVASPSGGTIARPRLLIAERDPFSGLAILRARLAAGLRPSDDLAGWALSYVLTGDEAIGRRAIDAMRTGTLPKGGPSRIWKTWILWSLAFDWLYGHPGFDSALKDRIAGELVDGAARNLALQSLADPSQASYHNHSLRELVLPVFALAAVEGHASVEERARPLREQARRALDNVLETTELVDPDGSYHESMDYQRITWVPLALLAELRRTTTGVDPAQSFGVFRNMGTTYLYKVLPDGSMARDDDNEYPPMNAQDREVLAYAIHRFKDPFAAWVQQKSGWLPERGDIGVLGFLWRDDAVVPRDPAGTTEAELPRRKLFRGVGHLVLRSGWGKDATWIQLASGPYFAKHDHLDMNHFVIYHRGHLAIDAGADYTDTESPHYLNHYRRTVAHNTLLVYRKGERFFWGEDKWPAANDGGQRMDSSRFWNTVRSLEDWRRTRDLWDRGRVEAFESVPGAYDFARADGTRAYSPAKLDRFVRELTYLPGPNVLFVLDRVRSLEAGDRKVSLLHGVGKPSVEGGAGQAVGHGGTAWADASVVTFEDGEGRLRIHPVLPLERELVVRGGPGWEFWTPGDEVGGDWGSGKNWPLDPPEGGPLPADPYLKKMWQTFWGGDMEKLSPSNRQAVVPGGWRIEVSPGRPSRDDVFLSILEIGDKGAAPLRIERVVGHRLAGAVVGGAAAVLQATEENLPEAEATLPDLATTALLLTGLEPGVSYELQFTSGFAPGSPLWRQTVSASDAGVVHVPWNERSGRLRARRLGGRS